LSWSGLRKTPPSPPHTERSISPLKFEAIAADALGIIANWCIRGAHQVSDTEHPHATRPGLRHLGVIHVAQKLIELEQSVWHQGLLRIDRNLPVAEDHRWLLQATFYAVPDQERLAV
jgi:hypothetical protein